MLNVNIVEGSIPWYRQFWPWFLIALLGTVITASFITLAIAIMHPHDLVNDQYYREGLTINQRIEQDLYAAELDMQASITFDADTSTMSARLQGQDRPHELKLLLMHPLDVRRDKSVTLKSDSHGVYHTHLLFNQAPRYYLRLLPSDESWRLEGEINLINNHDIELHSR